MDPNLMSCPTCGHSVSNASGACAYCGAMMSENQPPPTDETVAAEDAQSIGVSPPSTAPDKSDPAEGTGSAGEPADMTETVSAVGEAEESTEPAPEPNAAAPDTVTPTEKKEKQTPEEVGSQTASIEAEPEKQDEAEIVQLPPDSTAKSDISPAADPVDETITAIEDLTIEDAASPEPAADIAELGPAVPAESVSTEARSGSSVEEIQLTALANSEDVAVDEPGESEVLGENIIELAEIQNIEAELEKTSASEASTSSPTLVESEAADNPQPSPPKSDAGVPIDATAGLVTESLGDTILLEDVADEVQTEARKESDKTDKSDRNPSGEATSTKEKSSTAGVADTPGQDASATEPQPEKKTDGAASDAEALKKQKAALAKARAVKKQKMILAKAAALKRKKAAQAKAQALKKQEAARAGVEKAKEKEIAAAKPAAAGKNLAAQSSEASSKLMKLLEKYKGRAVGINYDNSADIREAQLVEANGEYFSVFVKDKKLKYSYPLKTILTVIEGKDGVEAGESGKKSKFNAVIKVYPLVLF